MTVEEAGQGGGVHPGVNDGDAGNRRARGGINMDCVPAVLQTGGEVGHQRLGTAELRLPDWGHERRDDGNPHYGRIL